jgi:hypothetical protein
MTSILGSFKDGENTLMIANPATTDGHGRLFFKKSGVPEEAPQEWRG